jgi:hypothetical protein
MVIWYIFPVLVSFSEKNLATLTVARATINQSLHGISVSHVTKKHCRVNGPWTVVIIAIASRFFVERSSTIERYCQPPPNFGNDCQLHARSSSRARHRNHARTIYIFSIFLLQLQFTSAILKVPIYKCNLQLQLTSFAQPQGKCLLLFFP